MDDEKDEAKASVSGRRSPSYPGLDLEEAINKVKKLWEAEHKNETPPEVVAKHWEYSHKASPFLVAIASLKKYGLLESGNDGMRSVKVSKLAMQILLGGDEEAADRAKATQEAALKPAIFLEFWKKYGKNLPSDGSLKQQLLVSKNFTPSGAETFIKTYRKTLSFAKLLEGDILINVDGSEQEEPTPDLFGQQKVNPPVPQTSKLGQSGQTRDLTIPLIGGGAAFIRLPTPLTLENFSLIQDFLNMLQKALVSDGQKELEKKQ